jgi:hypothetical protein
MLAPLRQYRVTTYAPNDTVVTSNTISVRDDALARDHARTTVNRLRLAPLARVRVDQLNPDGSDRLIAEYAVSYHETEPHARVTRV